jgi:hypothetical protein
MVPRVRIDRSTLVNHTTTDITFGGEVKALEAHAKVPAYQPFFNGLDYALGPVYDQTYPIAALPTIDVWKSQWSVDGFSTVDMRPLAIEPA